MLFNGYGYLLTVGHCQYFSFNALPVNFKPLGYGARAVDIQNRLDFFAVAALCFDADGIAGFEQIRRDVDFFTVDQIMTMANKLSAFRAGIGPAQQINDIVQTAFADAQQVFARDALLAFSHKEIFMELPFLNTVITPCLLLRAQLQTIFGSLFAALTVLAGRISAAFNGAFARIAAFTLQEKLFAFAAAQFADRTGLSCHMSYTS